MIKYSTFMRSTKTSSIQKFVRLMILITEYFCFLTIAKSIQQSGLLLVYLFRYSFFDNYKYSKLKLTMNTSSIQKFMRLMILITKYLRLVHDCKLNTTIRTTSCVPFPLFPFRSILHMDCFQLRAFVSLPFCFC